MLSKTQLRRVSIREDTECCPHKLLLTVSVLSRRATLKNVYIVDRFERCVDYVIFLVRNAPLYDAACSRISDALLRLLRLIN